MLTCSARSAAQVLIVLKKHAHKRRLSDASAPPLVPDLKTDESLKMHWLVPVVEAKLRPSTLDDLLEHGHEGDEVERIEADCEVRAVPWTNNNGAVDQAIDERRAGRQQPEAWGATPLEQPSADEQQDAEQRQPGGAPLGDGDELPLEQPEPGADAVLGAQATPLEQTAPPPLDMQSIGSQAGVGYFGATGSQAMGEQDGPPWGLDRSDSCYPLGGCASTAKDSKYKFGGARGEDAIVYVIDTGVRISHVDFGGRAIAGYSALCESGSESSCWSNGGQWVRNGVIDDESGRCNDHGTHCAGTVGGATYGVAKATARAARGAHLPEPISPCACRAPCAAHATASCVRRLRQATTIVAVQGLSCTGSGYTSTVIAGIEWSVMHATRNGYVAAVISMSLGGGASDVQDDAVAAAHDAGVSVVSAASGSRAAHRAQIRRALRVPCAPPLRSLPAARCHRRATPAPTRAARARPARPSRSPSAPPPTATRSPPLATTAGPRRRGAARHTRHGGEATADAPTRAVRVWRAAAAAAGASTSSRRASRCSRAAPPPTRRPTTSRAPRWRARTSPAPSRRSARPTPPSPRPRSPR